MSSAAAASEVSVQDGQEAEMAALLVEALHLDGVDPAAIDPTAPLFGHNQAGLGLDSIDALEIALAIQQRYGVELRSDNENTRQIFGSLRALSAHVQSCRLT